VLANCCLQQQRVKDREILIPATKGRARTFPCQSMHTKGEFEFSDYKLWCAPTQPTVAINADYGFFGVCKQ